MLSRVQIGDLFKELNERLIKENVKGELCVVGGASMMLCFDSRGATKDVDGIFSPKSVIQTVSYELANDHPELKLEPGWLNDACSIFMSDDPSKGKPTKLLDLSNLKVWSPDPKYLLAMKVLAARMDTHDYADIEFLIEHLELDNSEEVISIVNEFLPTRKNKVAEEARIFIEDFFDRKISEERGI